VNWRVAAWGIPVLLSGCGEIVPGDTLRPFIEDFLRQALAAFLL
jgi:hypothetical protein